MGTVRRPLLDVDEAQRRLVAAVAPNAAVTVPVRSAVGCVLATAVTAAEDVPNTRTSAMDGHAVRARDTGPGACLPVVATVLAGGTASGLPEGAAARVMTGAMLPDGADSVVPLEDSTTGPGGVVLATTAAAGRHVRPAGEDVARGALLGAAGDRVSTGLVTAATAAGVHVVRAHRRPSVAVLSTGDELVPASAAQVRPGGVRNSNLGLLCSVFARADAAVTPLGHVADDPSALRAALAAARAAHDVVVTTGGVSVGDADHLPALLAELGPAVAVHLRLRPGRPVAWLPPAPAAGDGLVLSLPGSPLAALATAVLLGVPVLRRLGGAAPEQARALARRPLRDAVAAADGRTEVRLAQLCETAAGPVVAPGPGRGSLDLLARADAVAVLRPGAPTAAGDLVEVLALG